MEGGRRSWLNCLSGIPAKTGLYKDRDRSPGLGLLMGQRAQRILTSLVKKRLSVYEALA